MRDSGSSTSTATWMQARKLKTPRTSGFHVFLAVVMATLLVLAGPPGCSKPQARGHSDPRSVRGSRSETEMGLEILLSFDRTLGLATDDERQARIDSLGYALAAAAGDPGFAPCFAVVELDVPNAMMLPGDFVLVTTGMLDLDLDDERLAALLAHELAHGLRNHILRSQRLASVMSVVDFMLMAALTALVSNMESDSRLVQSTPADPAHRRAEAIEMSGGSAIRAGAGMAAAVLETLLHLAYTRQMEYEADRVGTELAFAAGFPRDCMASMLETLRSVEYDPGLYAYWKTHPMTEERIQRARDLARALGRRPARLPRKPQDVRLLAAYRMLDAALHAKHPAVRRLAERMGRRLGTDCSGARPSLALLYARSLAEIEEAKQPLMRDYSLVLAAYDAAIGDSSNAEGALWAEREAMAHRQRDLLSSYESVLDSKNPRIGLLETFLRNFPSHPRATEARLKAARQYVLAGKPGRALRMLWPLLKEGCGPSRPDSVGTTAFELALTAADSLGSLETCYTLIDSCKHPSCGRLPDALCQRLGSRMEVLIHGDLDLHEAGVFLHHHPRTPWTEAIAERADEAARKMLKRGLVLEGLKEYQEALECFAMVVLFARDSSLIEKAKQGVERIRVHEKAAAG